MRSKLLLEDIGQLARIGGWELHTSNGMSMVWTDEMRTMFEVETGFTPSLEKFISSYKQGEDREALVQAIEKARKNGTGWDLELQMVTEKGNTRWVRSRGKADFENGSCKRLYGFIQDIHEEKLKTIPEKNDDHRYRLLTDNIKSVICLHDREGHFTYISPSFEDVTGLTPSEVIGNLPIDYIHPDDVELVRNHFIQHAKNEANIELKGMEYRYRHKDGHYIWVRSLVRPILENNLVQSLQTDTYVIQKLKDLEESLVSYSSMQNLLMKIASEYINIPLKKVDDAINKSLKEMGEFVDADRTYVFEYDFEKSITNSTYEWCAEGITPQIEELQAVPLKVLQDWIRTHLQGQPMYIPDVSALSKGSLRELLESQDIKSLLALPMMNGDKCVGFVGFDSVKNHHSYTEKELNILKLFSQMLVNIQLRFEEERALVKAKEVAEESQNTLMREAHFYRSMVDNQSFYLIKMSTDARYTFVNDYYCNKVNLNYVSAIGKKMINNIHYDDHYKFLETIQKCLHSPEETHRIVLRSVLRNGEVIQNQWDFKG
ncbi:MAG: PAS domain-containing protein, partial [Bacteroidota bacterium]